MRACTGWTPAYQGLGFTPETLAVNTSAGADDGTLYSTFGAFFEPGSVVVKLAAERAPSGASDVHRAPPEPGPAETSRASWSAPGAPPALYVPCDETGPIAWGSGSAATAGTSWVTALDGIGIGGLAADPRDPTRLHQLARRGFRTLSGPSLIETHDGWVTWSRADQGLPRLAGSWPWRWTPSRRGAPT